jgi:hypothetical protein
MFRCACLCGWFVRTRTIETGFKTQKVDYQRLIYSFAHLLIYSFIHLPHKRPVFKHVVATEAPLRKRRL